MFSKFHEDLAAGIGRILSRSACPPVERAREILEKSSTEALGLPELADLLEIGTDPAAGEQFQELRSFTLRRFRKREGNRLRYIAPIYLSSYCVDTCGYCNFSAARRMPSRKRLSLEELDAELATVLGLGARVIELVLATDPELPWTSLERYVARTVDAVGREPGSGVLLCSDYLTAEAYAALRDAGLWGMVQWDETLDRQAYHRWHATSPRKWNFEERVDNHGRAMETGLEVATGALFGLADFRYDLLMQVAKARFLESEYGRKPFVFGTARLKPIGGRELHPATEVRDRAYETALMVFQLAEPSVGRWLQTRETFELNLRNMLDGDAFTYRCGEVRPGGYDGADLLPATSIGGQFAVHELSRADIEQELSATGFGMELAWTGRNALEEHAVLPARERS